MKVLKLLLILVVTAGAFGGGYLLRGSKSPAPTAAGERKILYYVDPMHPAYKSDKPGTAPDCGMALEPVYADEGAPSAATSTERKVLYYRDPKRPEYTATAPGLDPETGNTLEPVYAAVDASVAAPPGAVRISADRQQLIGITYAAVESTDGGRVLRTVGKVAYDETRLQHVHPRIEGWIEKVMVDFTGQFVKKGQAMLTLYSPEMLATQEELLLARRARDVMQGNPLAAAEQQGESLFQATRRRLELWNLSADQIDRVLETGQPIRNVTLHAPATGFVLERNAYPNQRVTSESDLYVLADLSRVWIMADVFEADVTAITMGSPARIQLSYGAATKTLSAKVNYVQPGVDPTTRTLKVRLEAPNPGLRLLPEMFVNVEFAVTGGRQLTVPASAVLNTGDRQTAFVDLGDGYLQPRQVQVGGRVGDRVVIVSGLSEGERVVASGNFLVDSESQLKAALGGMGGAQHQHGAAPATAPAKATPQPSTSATPPQSKPAAPKAPAPGAHVHD